MKKELTWQSVFGALLIAGLISAAFPYVVLKLGMGPNISILSAFLGAIFLTITARGTLGHNKLQNNIIQTAGTTAASTAFMCIVAAAFGYLDMDETVDVHVVISSWEMFVLLTCSGMLGVLFITLFRNYFLNDPKMVFADGVAAGETIVVLDTADDPTAKLKFRVMGILATLAAGLSFVRDALGKIGLLMFVPRFKIGIEWNVLSMGTGMLIGPNVALAGLLGSLLIWAFGPTIIDYAGLNIVSNSINPTNLSQCLAHTSANFTILDETTQSFIATNCGHLKNYLTGNHFTIVMLWTMWPATTLMISAACVAVLLRWRSIVSMFRELQARGTVPETERDIRPTALFAMALLISIVLAIFMKRHFDMSYFQTVVAIVAQLPLMLVGVRVLGETNNGPVSLMANGLQAVFAVFWPQSMALNLIAAGSAGAGNANAEGAMQDYRTGRMVGSTPSVLTYVQLAAVPIGAVAVAIMYPLLIAKYGLGGDGLSAPTGLKLANMAILLAKGMTAFPPGALLWSVIAAIIGVIYALVKEYGDERWTCYIPNASGLGFGLILPGVLNLPIAMGAVFGWIWQQLAPQHYERYMVTVASAFICGEALVAGLALPVMAVFGWM